MFMCLAGFPAARRCHSCVQIKNGKDSKWHFDSISVIVSAENDLFSNDGTSKGMYNFGESLED